MKRNLFMIIAIIFLTTGCTRTLNAVQQDTTDIWEDTKGAIHKVTAPN